MAKVFHKDLKIDLRVGEIKTEKYVNVGKLVRRCSSLSVEAKRYKEDLFPLNKFKC